MLVPGEISLLVTSDTTQGAIARGTTGSAFEIQLDEGLSVPKGAQNVTVSVEDSEIWWTVPNVISGENDTMYIFGDNDAAGTELFTLTIPQGLYDLTGFNNQVLSLLEAAGARTLDGGGNALPLVNFLADSATQKVILRLNYTNVYVDFSQVQTPREILGFDSLQYGPEAGAPLNLLAPNVAAFNTVNYFLIHSDLVNKGLRINNAYNQTIAKVLIDVAPGSQIVSTPFNPASTPAPELAGAKRTNLRFWLTDDQQNAVNTNSENWSARIVIRYLKPFIISRGS